MDQSPISDRRSNLLREMTRRSNRDRASGASSDGSDRGSYQDFETESQILPALPAITANNAAGRPREPDYQINTSALRRAFPDFSQYGSSEDDSLEIGRGSGRNPRQSTGRVLPSEDPSENISLDFGGEKFTVTGTPPLKPKTHRAPMADHANTEGAPSLKRTTSEKENADPQPLAKTADYVSSAGSRDSRGKRQALRELQASVESDNSVSVTGERPKPVHNSTKSTRFNSTRSRQPLSEALTTPNTRATHVDNNGTLNSVTSAVNGTFQSFALPDLPNITELVSGQRKDGYPLFSKSAKSRSRFAAPSSLRKSQSGKSSHISIDNIAVPADAKALYVSLQILQEKYAVLEQEKAQAVDKADSYELECLQLKSKVEEKASQHARQHSDSGFDVNDVESDRSQLEASIRSLQSRLHRATKKVSESEAIIKHLTKDRDAAHQQLALAFVNSEELKNEGQAVREEIVQVKAQLVKVTRQHERRLEELTQQETELRGKIERREKAVHEMAALANELWDSRKALASIATDENARNNAPSRPFKRTELQRDGGSANKTTQSRAAASVHSASAQRDASVGLAGNGMGQTRRPRSTSGHSLRIEEDHLSEDDPTTHLDLDLAYSKPGAIELTKDDTYMSFMEGDEVAKLRRIVEQDKARLAQAGVNVEALISHENLSSALNVARTSALPRKSSLKSLASQSQKQKQATILADGYSREITKDAFNDAKSQTNHTAARMEDMHKPDNDNTRQSVLSQRSETRRRSAVTDDMTSALILPDITLAESSFAQRDPQAKAGSAIKQTMTVHRPIPVSDRVVEPGVENEDPTLRPSQSPAVALATVLHDLEDEVEHLQQQLARYEKLYNQHDPSLSKRKRKAVYECIQKLLAAIETRSDQVYALYDVLEGQKESGQMMDESEVEVTPRDLGIEFAAGPEHRRRPASTGKTAGDKHGKKVTINDNRSDSGSESDLPFESPSDDEQFGAYEDSSMPWEGIEATHTHTIGSLRGSGVPAAPTAAAR